MTREEAIKILSSRDGHGIPSGYNSGYAEAIEVAIEVLEAEPVKHGRWIDVGSGQECSVCGEMQYGYDSYRNYCANCGARMDGITDDVAEEIIKAANKACANCQEFVCDECEYRHWRTRWGNEAD